MLPDKRTILVTGGAGYIGAHTVRELIKAGFRVVVIDNLQTGSRSYVSDEAVFVEGDFAEEILLSKIFADYRIEAVMHFAASIEVGESVEKPMEYLENNTLKTARLIQAMLKHGVNRLIFSSTAAVYGLQEKIPIAETAPTAPLDPYGYSKLLTENLIQFHVKFAGLQAIIFRYFNACGSDFDKFIYSLHESHLIPRVIDAAEGRQQALEIYGTDYSTVDGTGVRDYVHVLDVARAHALALDQISSNCEIYNIGTGVGLSVKQIISAAERITDKAVPVKVLPRRAGDSPITIADNTKIKDKLGFKLEHSDIETIIKTSWH